MATTEKEDQVAAALSDALLRLADRGTTPTWADSPMTGYIAGFTYRGVAFSLTVHETE